MAVPEAAIDEPNASLDPALQNAILARKELSPWFRQVARIVELSQYSGRLADDRDKLLGREPI